MLARIGHKAKQNPARVQLHQKERTLLRELMFDNKKRLHIVVKRLVSTNRKELPCPLLVYQNDENKPIVLQ